MGLLNYIEGLLPKPSEADIEKMRRSIQKQKNAPSGFGGLMLGPSDAEKAQLRQQRGIPQAEEPSPWVSVGRGVTDLSGAGQSGLPGRDRSGARASVPTAEGRGRTA